MPDAKPTRTYRTRLDVLFAADAHTAVILRRGPRKHFHLIGWNTRNDTFEHGQWMKGIVRLYDLSPDGQRLIYWAAQYHDGAPRYMRTRSLGEGSIGGVGYEPLLRPPLPQRRVRRKVPRYQRIDPITRAPPPRALRGVWTAISRPPWFTALAIWPCFGHWTGGGIFRGNGSIVLFESEDGMQPLVNVAIPKGIVFEAGLPRWRAERPLPQAAYMPTNNESETHEAIADALRHSGFAFVDWIDIRNGKRMTFAADGRIFRVADWMGIAPDDFAAHASLVADFRDLKFELRSPPPEALVW